MTKEEEIVSFLSGNVFNPVLNSSASDALKKGVRYTIMSPNNLNAEGMISY